MEDSVKPAMPPARRCWIGFFFLEGCFSSLFGAEVWEVVDSVDDDVARMPSLEALSALLFDEAVMVIDV